MQKDEGFNVIFTYLVHSRLARDASNNVYKKKEGVREEGIWLRVVCEIMS